MNRKRLALRRECLADLGGDDLVAVVGGTHYCTGKSCLGDSCLTCAPTHWTCQTCATCHTCYTCTCGFEIVGVSGNIC